MAEEQEKSVPKVYSAPRRFDLATIMVVTIAYALLFTVLRLVRSPPMVFVVVAGWITCVGIGQALLFGGHRPRLSSVLVGVVLNLGFCVYLMTGRAIFIEDVIWFAFVGAILGYVAGAAVGSVFLFSELLRNSIQRWRRQ